MPPKRTNNKDNKNNNKKKKIDDQSSDKSSSDDDLSSSNSSEDGELSDDELFKLLMEEDDDYEPNNSDDEDEDEDDGDGDFEPINSDDDLDDFIVNDNPKNNKIVIPLEQMLKLLFNSGANRPPPPPCEDDIFDSGNDGQTRTPRKDTLRKKRFRENPNETKKKNIKRRKVDIIENINTIDDFLAIADKYEDKPDLHYSVNIKHLKALKEPLLELKNMVGLDDIKTQIIAQIKYLLSHLEDEDLMLHTALFGPPGVGKTSLAHVLSKIYCALGFSNGKMRPVKRSELVAGYLGQTAKLTQKVIDESKGGVLFIDEAYSLGNPENRDSFSKEAIDTICQNLTELKSKIICIIAGYKDEVEKCFFSVNPGLARRFPFRYEIKDYTAPQLAEIFKSRITLTGWTIDDIPNSFFESNMIHFTENGGDMENLSQKVKMTYSDRIFGKHQEITKHLTLVDVEKAMKVFIANKPNKNDDHFDKNIKPRMYL